jgi:hypothetical protein
MNGTRDIDRVLDAWFVDGPSIMPDRLFDAVLDQVERVPQRRLARLSLRYAEMSPRIRLFTVLAAALVVVVAAIAVMTGGSKGLVTATQAPTLSPTLTPAAAPSVTPGAPAGLQARWMSGTRAVPGIEPQAGTSIMFTVGGGAWLSPSNHDNQFFLRSRVDTVGEDTIRVTSQTAEPDCADPGTYTWQLSPSGQSLQLASEDDSCATRRAAFTGTFWKTDCPTENNYCLGPVDAGTYASQYFDPFVAHDGPWKARFGALEYTVPAGWGNGHDWPEFFGLGPSGQEGNPQIYFASDVLPVPDDDQCKDAPSTTVGRSAEAIAGWVDGLAGVDVVTPLEQVTVGGLPAWQIDIRIAKGWTATCPWNTEHTPDRVLFTDGTPANDGFSWGIPGGSSMRLWLVDLGDGRALMIDFESETQATFVASVDDATTVVGSYVLNR